MQATAPGLSFALGGAPSKSIPTHSRKRPQSALQEELEIQGDNSQEQIVEFGAPPSKAQRVIHNADTTDLKDILRKRKRGGHETARTSALQRPAHDDPEQLLGKSQREDGQQSMAETTEQAEGRQKSADEEALDALLGNQRSAHSQPIIRMSEEEAFTTSYENAPSAPTIDDFKATPVDGFGAALLRGYLKKGKTLEDYGYDENSTTKAIQTRPTGLGLGAKSSGIPEIELGSWGKAAKRNGQLGYMPLAMKSKTTGEVISQDEFNKSLARERESDANGKLVSRSRDSDTHGNGDGRRERRREYSRDRNDRHGYDRRRDRRRSEEASADDAEDSRRDRHRRDERRGDRDHRQDRHRRDGDRETREFDRREDDRREIRRDHRAGYDRIGRERHEKSSRGHDRSTREHDDDRRRRRERDHR